MQNPITLMRAKDNPTIATRFPPNRKPTYAKKEERNTCQYSSYPSKQCLMKRFRSRSGGVFSYPRIHENVLHCFGGEPRRGLWSPKAWDAQPIASKLVHTFQGLSSKILAHT